MVKTFTIKDDVYNKLKNQKRKDECFNTCLKNWWARIYMEELMLYRNLRQRDSLSLESAAKRFESLSSINCE